MCFCLRYKHLDKHNFIILLINFLTSRYQFKFSGISFLRIFLIFSSFFISFSFSLSKNRLKRCRFSVLFFEKCDEFKVMSAQTNISCSNYKVRLKKIKSKIFANEGLKSNLKYSVCFQYNLV